MKKLRRRLTQGYVYANRLLIIINICFVVLGVVAGCIMFLYSDAAGSIYDRLYEMFFEIKDANAKEIFANLVLNYALVCGVFYVCSLFYIGVFLSPVYVFVRCIAYGFSSCLVINCYEAKGVLIVLLGLAPQMVFYLIGLIIFSVETSKQSRYIGNCFDKVLRKKSVITYFTTSLIPIIIIFSGCLVESFMAPPLILWCLQKV